MHTLHRRQFLVELRDVDQQGITDEGNLMLAKVKRLLLVGLAQSNNWVEVLLRRVMLDEYLQEVGDGINVNIAARRKLIDNCLQSSAAFNNEFGPRPSNGGFNELTDLEL